jgi:hypothetical protein
VDRVVVDLLMAQLGQEPQTKVLVEVWETFLLLTMQAVVEVVELDLLE